MRNNTFIALALGSFLLSACNDKVAPVDGNTAPSAEPSPSVGGPEVSRWNKPTAELPRTALCNIDAINGIAPGAKVEISRDRPLSIAGWVSTTNLKNPGKFSLVFEGANSFMISSSTNAQRPDVATGYKSVDLANSGFSIDLPSLNAQPGNYHLSVQHQGADSATLCDGKVDILIR